MTRSVSLSLALVAPLTFAVGCRDTSTPPGPQADCESVCVETVHGCTEHECAKGCAFILDRLVEHEGPTVLACVASRTKGPVDENADAKSRCGNPVWAECAVRVGVHADGGPPAPASVGE